MPASSEETRAYMRAYYLAHSKRPPMIAGATRESKKCKKCSTVKDRSEYGVRKSGPRTGHLLAYCKACSVSVSKARIDRDPTIYRRIEWPSKLKTTYGITVDDYYRMLSEQGGGCALCGTKDPVPGNRTYKRSMRTAFDVDHCHKTGRVRGLLCTRCNRLVGLAGDSVETARNLVNYLVKKEN